MAQMSARGALMAQMSAHGALMAQMSARDEQEVGLASSSKEAEVGPSTPRARPPRFRREPAAPGRAGSRRLNAGCAASG